MGELRERFGALRLHQNERNAYRTLSDISSPVPGSFLFILESTNFWHPAALHKVKYPYIDLRVRAFEYEFAKVLIGVVSPHLTFMSTLIHFHIERQACCRANPHP
jgi:hypothetical protein